MLYKIDYFLYVLSINIKKYSNNGIENDEIQD